MEYVGFIASLAMGIILGLMGGGGSILTVPILVYLFALPPSIATTYSLFIVGTTALMGSIIYLRKGEVNFQTGFTFALPSIFGVNFSRGVIIPQIPEIVAQVGAITLRKEILIMLAFAILMVSASYSMIRKRSDQKAVESHSNGRFFLIILQGLLVGMIAGFVGAGGGFLIVPVLIFMARLPMRIAVGTSLLIITFQSLLGFLGDLVRGLVVNWTLLGAIATFAVVGIVAGSAIASKIKEQKLKSAFGWFVLIVGITILLEQFRHLSP